MQYPHLIDCQASLPRIEFVCIKKGAHLNINHLQGIRFSSFNFHFDPPFCLLSYISNTLLNKELAFFTNRTTATTYPSVNSSSSHSVLLLKIVKTDLHTLKQCHLSKVFLVDLAGPEDNQLTGNEGSG